MQKVLFGFSALLLVAAMPGPSLSQANSGSGRTALVIKAADIKATAEKDPPTTPLSDHLVALKDAGEYNVGVAIVHRGKPKGNILPDGLAHSEITEVYIMQSGEATVVTGGTMDNPKPSTAPSGTIGPTFSFGPLKNGVSRDVGPGDVTIIPTNTPHYFSAVKSDEIVYMIDRIDLHHVLHMPDQTAKGQVQSHYDFPSKPEPAVDVKGAEIDALANQSAIVQMLGVTDINHQYNIGLALRRLTPGSDSLLSHKDITEIYHIISGHAILTTGGSIADGKESAKVDPRIGPTISGKKLVGGTDVEVGPGDVAIIPPNVAHYYSKIDSDKIVYLVVRVDPHHVVSMLPEDAKAAAAAAAGSAK